MKYNFTTITYCGLGKNIINHNLKTLKGVENRILKGYVYTPFEAEKVEIYDKNNKLIKIISIDDIFEYRYNSLEKDTRSAETIFINEKSYKVYRDIENIAYFKIDGKVKASKVLYDKNVDDYMIFNGNKIYIDNLK
ncbi:hypothetical protein [Fusobacterium sp.]|uniref:hypothetical protein n=1 Tax=Fusobacterium sp. TaxID=68766 RepID=UPI0026337641|nr:hypothetical protein [Fusobacterium sp.]